MSIVKDCGEIWSRLFDHQPFIQPEISTFIREFEEKRSDREVENLLNILNVQCEIQDQCERLSQHQSSPLDSLNDKVVSCLDQSERIFSSEKSQTLKTVLENRRQERAKRWDQIKKSMESKYIEVDAQFIKEQEEIKTFYKEKENTLKC